METKNNKMAKTKSTGQNLYDKFCEVNKHTNTEELTPSDVAALHASGVDTSKLKPATGGGRPHKLSLEHEALVLKLVQSNFSIASIAEQFDISKQTIYNIVERKNNNN